MTVSAVNGGRGGGSGGGVSSADEAADLAFLGPAAADKLAALVFELASQLHEERVRRQALENILTRAGLLDTAALEAVAADEGFREQSRADADASIRRLLRIISESGAPQRPLRAEALTEKDPDAP